MSPLVAAALRLRTYTQVDLNKDYSRPQTHTSDRKVYGVKSENPLTCCLFFVLFRALHLLTTKILISRIEEEDFLSLLFLTSALIKIVSIMLTYIFGENKI